MSRSLAFSPQLVVVTLALWLHCAQCTSEEGIEVSAILGSDVTFHCELPRADPPNLAWFDWVYPEGRDAILAWNISTGKNMDHYNKERFDVDPETLDLTVTGINTEDQGDYFCRSVVDGETQESEISLIVSSKPMCNGVHEVTDGGRLNMVCAAEYSGAVPELQWYRGDMMVDSEREVNLGHVQNTYKADITYDMDDNILTCKMNFEGKTDECSRTLDVKFRVHDPVYTPMATTYGPGDVITCSALGNPTPAMEMYVPGQADPKMGEDMSFVVDDSWEGTEVTVNCTASNVFNGETEIRTVKHTFQVEAPKPDPADATTPRAATPEPDNELNDKSTPKAVVAIEATSKPTTPRAGAVEGEDPNNGAVTSAGTNMVAIVAGIVIGALVLVIIIVAVVCVQRRKGKKVPKGSKAVPMNDVDAEVGEKA